jgi:hypothetical protein
MIEECICQEMIDYIATNATTDSTNENTLLICTNIKCYKMLRLILIVYLVICDAMQKDSLSLDIQQQIHNYKTFNCKNHLDIKKLN